MDIGESVQALLGSRERVIERFYDQLLTQHPEVRHHFENRDLRIQASMLTVALASVEAYYSHHLPATEHYLRVLGHRHYHEGVPIVSLHDFKTVLLETLSEFFADDWHSMLATQWMEALDAAIELMCDGYKDTYTL